MKKLPMLAIAVGLLTGGVIYAAMTLERWDGTSDHIGLWNGPSTLTARTLNTPVGEVTGSWHYHPGFVYNVVRQGTITIEDGCGGVQSYSAGQAFETSEGRRSQRVQPRDRGCDRVQYVRRPAGETDNGIDSGG